MPSPFFPLSVTAGLDWLAGLANLDRYPPSPPLPSPEAVTLLHSELRTADTLSRRIGEPDHIPVQRVVTSTQPIPLRKNSSSQVEVLTGGFSVVQKSLAKFANK